MSHDASDASEVLYQQAARALRQGRPAEALDPLESYLTAHPGNPEALNLMGIAALRLGRPEMARQVLIEALKARPDFVEALSNLGSACQALGDLATAEKAFRAALHIQPAFAAAHYNLGNLLAQQDKWAEAEAAYTAALSHEPRHPGAWRNLGTLLLDQGRDEEAEKAFDALTEAAPVEIAGWLGLGEARRRRGRLFAAEQALSTAAALDPGDPRPQTNLGNLLAAQGRSEEALPHYRRAHELTPEHPWRHGNLLCAHQYLPDTPPAMLRRLHEAWAARHGLQDPPARPRPDPEGPLRLGLLSIDLGQHPVGFFMLGLVRALAAAPELGIEVHALSLRRAEDEDATSRRLAEACRWHRLDGLDDDALAGRIAGLGIDVLVDLAGHTAGNRLSLFARRPAPVQLSWAGYTGTTGLAAIDGLVCDRFHVPPGSEADHVERPLRLPHGYICYSPPEDAPPVAPLPLAGGAPPTFGCFNNPAKLNEVVYDLFAGALTRVPGSRLLMAFRGYEDATVRTRVFAAFGLRGIDATRLDLLGKRPHAEFLAAYGRVDVALDTHPYSGGLTTLEALWMGVPVVTLPGPTFASRHSLSHLANAGLGHLAARDAEDFARIAADLVGDPAALAELRAGLRARLLASPLLDHKGFARDFASHLRAFIAALP
ncbi:tetratricopeptide repeat protein [Roseospirillum parvum]|uniref:protein O-GlcNAc transferase n=1 Tax=Roseospirillum parvum TaxID=83401 RepID=A0A1G8BPS1_9PROT|nr:tetratricopeptide repeat protein [Roseospirillum parvum]SDH35064.1 Predicted O-linked N-acetylglucosamine transferase, SPINDLY family [Roseospirillum parvum]